MGNKNKYRLKIMDAVALSGTATVTSAIQNVATYDDIGLQVAFTGTMTGTLSVIGSIDGVNFPSSYALTFNPVLTQPTGSALAYLININQFPWYYMQVSYTNASGSGALTVWISTKDLN